jgi:hypothetical protein
MDMTRILEGGLKLKFKRNITMGQPKTRQFIQVLEDSKRW